MIEKGVSLGLPILWFVFIVCSSRLWLSSQGRGRVGHDAIVHLVILDTNKSPSSTGTVNPEGCPVEATLVSAIRNGNRRSISVQTIDTLRDDRLYRAQAAANP
jgi:hypothetical protein